MRGRIRYSRVVLFAILGMLLFLSQVEYPTRINQTERQAAVIPMDNVEPAYTPHGPIVINSDFDFGTQGWQGNGTESNPYLIEDLNITTDGTCIDIDSVSVHFRIQSCFLRPTSGSYAIWLEDAPNGTIDDCVIPSPRMGIFLSNCNNTVINGTIVDAQVGSVLTVAESHRIELTHCTLSFTGTDPIGDTLLYLGSSNSLVKNCVFNDIDFSLKLCENATFEDNSFTRGGLYIWGVVGPPPLFPRHWNHTITSNTVNGKTLGYFVSESDLVLDGDSFGQIILFECTEVSITGGSIENTSVAVQIAYSQHCIVSELDLTRVGTGVTVYESNYSIIEHCTKTHSDGYLVYCTESSHCSFSYNLDGFPSTSIWIESGTDNIVAGNRIFARNFGINLYSESVSSCMIRDNYVANCQYGIYALGSSHIIENNTIMESSSSGVGGKLTSAQITGNVIRRGFGDGIKVLVNDSVISQNWVTENDGTGVLLQEGSNGNTIFNNSIGFNIGSNAQDDGFNNQWDNGVSIGNLWSDFHTTPPYLIPGTAGSEDRYPLADTTPPILEGWGTQNLTQPGNYPIQWYAFDFAPAVFEVFVDGELDHIGDWYNDLITYRFHTNDLGLGLHNITIVVYDMFGNSASHTVWVQYGYVTTPPTTPSELPDIDIMSVLIMVSIVGAAFIVIAVWRRRER